MRLGYAEHFQRRARIYRKLQLWAAVISTYMFALAGIFSLPPASSNTAFANIAVGPNQANYWISQGISVERLGTDVHSMAWSWVPLAVVASWFVLIPAGIYFIFRRKLTPIIIILIALQLSTEASAGSKLNFVNGSIPANAISSTLLRNAELTLAGNQLTGEASQGAPRQSISFPAFGSYMPRCNLPSNFTMVRSDPAGLVIKPEGSNKLCLVSDHGTGIVTREGRQADSIWAMNELNFTLMQDAYLRNDAMSALRHLEALHPEHMTEASLLMQWRISIIREWAKTRGFSPSPASYKPDVPPKSFYRGVSFLTLSLGCIGSTGFLLAVWLGWVLRKRANRVAALEQVARPA